MNFTQTIPAHNNYLSEVFDFLPSNILLNKGMTGCGGTTLELTCPRNSIILVPTINLVENKVKEKMLGVTYLTSNQDILNYINSKIKYKKIIGTYDSLNRLMNIIPEYFNYFLLIDEYHYLFTHYKFRQEAVSFVLNNYYKFKNWCFLTATPLSETNILEELKDLDTLSLHWEGKAPLEITYSPTEFYNKLLEQRIYECINSDYNLHIFFNAFSTIKKIVNLFFKLDYRVVCSPHQKDKSSLNYQSINSKVRKINFYTSTAFEGVDIFDPVGKTIIVSDSNIITTMMDISISIPQIAGRIRDSKWVNKIEYIYSSKKHRYLNKDVNAWDDFVNNNVELGKSIMSLYNKANEKEKKGQLSLFSPETHFGKYINYKDNDLFYDNNLYKFDQDTYKMFVDLSKLYTQKPLVKVDTIKIKECVYKSEVEQIVYSFIIKGHEYTKPELDELFYLKGITNKPKTPLNFISTNFGNYTSKRRTIQGKKYTVYTFY